MDVFRPAKNSVSAEAPRPRNDSHPVPSQPVPTRAANHSSAFDELVSLAWEFNANQYRTVHLAARYDEELDWFHQGFKNPAVAICRSLQVHANTAREWIRVGHALRYLPLIDTAFARNEISYAKARILTRWADDDNEQELLDLARDRTANRLTIAIAQLFAVDEDDADRDARHHFSRGATGYTNAEGMFIIRMELPPNIGKPVLAAADELVRQIANTPADATGLDANTGGGRNTPADTFRPPSVTDPETVCTACGQNTPADTSDQHSVTEPPLADTLRELRQRWQPGADDDWDFPTLAQQRADAFVALFLSKDIHLDTEIVIHVRGDGNTFDDGTPITSSAVICQLPDSYIRALIHDDTRKPIDATNKRRFPTPRQKLVVLETHRHECVDCHTTDLLEFDHNPPFEQTHHTITAELETRCSPCHRARHRVELLRWADGTTNPTG